MYPSAHLENDRLREAKNYLKEQVEYEDTDPLEFWLVNKIKFANLSKMARDFLCIPATSVPVECIFSQACDLISKKKEIDCHQRQLKK
jgi:hypothetical protein